jgi:hypothetical protein
LHNSSLVPDRGENWLIKEWHSHRRYNFPWSPDVVPPGLNSDILRPCGSEPSFYNPLLIRPASSLEPTTDLQQPEWESCRVPIVTYISWLVSEGR